MLMPGGQPGGGGEGGLVTGGIDRCINLANQYLIGQVRYIKILT